ncbi:MAG: hypothetical protein ACOX7F_07895 [Eubacteriales bacterium]
MKKRMIAIVVGMLVLAMGAGSVWAAGNGAGRNYVDENGDGICDSRASGYGLFVDEDGDGVCDNWGSGRGFFVDEDGDGICDHCPSGMSGWGRGAGRGCHRR